MTEPQSNGMTQVSPLMSSSSLQKHLTDAVGSSTGLRLSQVGAGILLRRGLCFPGHSTSRMKIQII